MSQYSGGYVIAVVQNGYVVEASQDGRVAIPFGSDYVLRLINKNGVRAVAKVFIDGQNVSEGGIIVPANAHVDMERPTDKPVTFRFASTESSAAEAHGKAGEDVDGSKGLVKVEWRPERTYRKYKTGYLGVYSEKSSLHKSGTSYTPHNSVSRSMTMEFGPSYNSSVSGQSMGLCSNSMDYERSSLTSGGINLPKPELKSGVTVEGQHSSQNFRTVAFNIDYTVQASITTIKLVGYVAEAGIPVEGTKYCPSCRATTKKPSDKFCRCCGERL